MTLRQRRVLVWIGLAAAVAIGLVYAFWPRALPVDLTTAARGSLRVTIDEEGETRVRERFVVSAPVVGRLLRIELDPGDPVVPLTSFQEGTPLATLADMGGLIFKGTVDEIDVGKLAVGQPVRFKIGALPDAEVLGTLTLIAPKATEEEGATLFEVEAAIGETGGVTLRAGYSTNAEIIIEERAGVLLLPERLMSFEEEKTFVELPPADPEGEPVKQEISIGLSDGLHVEVTAGLEEGAEVVQRPPKEIGG